MHIVIAGDQKDQMKFDCVFVDIVCCRIAKGHLVHSPSLYFICKLKVQKTVFSAQSKLS